jgi:Ca2+-binding EF-hand superfamily protein
MKITHKNIKQASRVFRHMDSDHNGKIDKQEFMSYIKEIDGFKEIIDELKNKGSTKENMDRVWD